MEDFIWQWTKGNTTVYTKNTFRAEKAMKEGLFVVGKRSKPRILKY